MRKTIDYDITLHSDILAVDDSLAILKLVRQMLEGKYNVRIAQSAEIAYALLRRAVPDLILLDLEMPKIDGYAFFARINETPEWKNIPVIFITGADDREKEERALNMGAVDYILKPISEGVLLKRIKFHLELNLYHKKLEELVSLRTEELLKTQDELRETAEVAKESLRVKSVFLANMSHEIRTPMNSILGFTELALQDSIPPVTKDYLEKINSATHGLLDIINDVLDISKIESNKLILENIPFDINDVFKSCQTITQLKAAEKGITLFCYAEPAVNKKVIGDPTKLRQALLNLLSNAVKFTNHGMVKMLSSITASTENTMTVHFEVRDSGIGISPGQMDTLFLPFEQTDSSITRRYGGTGLGLPITKSIIELMGGRLEVESAPGLGSKFSFDLVFDTVESSAAEEEKRDGIHIAEKPIFKGHVLVCEDNIMNQQVITDHLSRVGLHITLAGNGKEGIDLVRQAEENKKPFDLIFMDVHMPVMDGFETAEKLRDSGSKTPVIALTANIMANNREICEKAGMVDYIAKPFTTQVLWGCLLKHLKPVTSQKVDIGEESANNKELQEKLVRYFWEDNQNTMIEIKEAIKGGYYKQARERAHTLKSMAALIHKPALNKAAYETEYWLTHHENEIKPELIDTLESELQAVMKDLMLKFKDAPAGNVRRKKSGIPIDAKNTITMLEKLEIKILESDLECLEYIEPLYAIPGTDELIRYMEQFDFTQAHEALSGLKRELGGENDERTA